MNLHGLLIKTACAKYIRHGAQSCALVLADFDIFLWFIADSQSVGICLRETWLITCFILGADLFVT